MRKVTVYLCSIFLLSVMGGSAAADDSLTVSRIMASPSITGSRARIAGLSPDGSNLLYYYSASEKDTANLWLADTRSGESQLLRPLGKNTGSIRWHPDGMRFLYLKKRDIYIYDVVEGESKRLTMTPGGESGARWTGDGTGILYRYDGIYHILPLDGTPIVQITKKAGDDESNYYGILSEDGKLFAFIRTDKSSLWEMHWVDYTSETVQPKSSKRGISESKIGLTAVDGKADVKWLDVPWEEKYRVYDIIWSHDSGKLLAHLVSSDFHARKIFVYDVEDSNWKKVWEEKDDKWIGGPNLDVAWSPDDEKILVASEKKGWNQLYLTEPEKKKDKRLMKGDWEVQEFKWLPDGRLFFASNEVDPAERHFYLLDIKEKESIKLNTGRGYNSGAVLSEDGSTIAYSLSRFGIPPEIWTLKLEADADPVRITNTIPDEYEAIEWTIPEIVEFESHVDKKTIRASLYKPADFDSTVKYPLVLFIHGAGYMQNVRDAWSYYYREFMFNTILNRLGYVVMDIDYRGSAGYGRDWRTDVYMHLGGLDLDDLVSGVKWAIEQGFADPERIGCYGGSYGGFLTLMALFKQPDMFAGGAALRAVTDWENYYYSNPYYSAQRFGKPEDNKEAYEISSPIHFADSLKSPVLILHGILDSNVQFQDAVQLVQKLIDAGKNFELMIYPKEAHSFRTPEAWTDEYSRILEFFEDNVRNK